ncbi:hypothetical protein [Tsuneonella sp. HG222]
MARAAHLSRRIADRSADFARALIVSGCGLALVLAGRALPF